MASKIPAVESISAESKALYDAINGEPDLPCVLIATSYLEQCVFSLLGRFFVESPETSRLLGEMGRFSTRAKLCYSLGLIPESLMQNLLTFGQIRNKFAHSHLALSFEDPEVVRLCDSLKFPAVAEWVGFDGQTGKVSRSISPWERFQHPRVKFTILAVTMSSRLLLSGLSTERRQVQVKGW